MARNVKTFLNPLIFQYSAIRRPQAFIKIFQWDNQHYNYLYIHSMAMTVYSLIYNKVYIYVQLGTQHEQSSITKKTYLVILSSSVQTHLVDIDFTRRAALRIWSAVMVRNCRMNVGMPQSIVFYSTIGHTPLENRSGN